MSKDNNTNENKETKAIQIALVYESIPDAIFCIASLGSLLTLFKERQNSIRSLSGNEAAALSQNLYQTGKLIEQISYGIIYAVSELEDSAKSEVK